jgi:hypothetical protein
MHIYNKMHVLVITVFSYMFRCLLRHLQRERLYILKITVMFCDYIGLQLLNNNLKNHVCFNMKLKMLQTYVITNVTTVLSKQKSSLWRWCNKRQNV